MCAALAAGLGGSGRYLVLCLSRFPLPAPRVPRCVWRAVPSGHPLSLLAGTPFHAVCAFRELGPVALLVVPACPLRVCALALLRRPLPPPLGGVACAPRAVPALGAGRAVPRGPCPTASPAPVPCSVWRAWGGGGGPVSGPPYLAWGCCCEGRLRSGAPSPPTARPLGGLLGSATHVLWARVCGCGGPTLSPWPACPMGAACRGGRVVGGRPQGGLACQCCEGRLLSGAVPPPTVRPLGQAAGVPRPVCSGCGRCGCGDPASAPRLAPLRAGVARRGGGGEGVSGGAAVRRCEGRLGSGAPPHPAARPLGGLPGPTTHWLWVRGGAGVGTRHQPHSARSCELALRPVGAARGRPGGAPRAWVWGVWGRALSQARLPALWAGCRGPLPTSCGCGGVRAGGPVTNPTARSCVLWRRHEGARGGRLLPGCWASGVGRSPTPDCPPSGRAAGADYPLAVGAGGCGRGDPSPTPQRALLRAGFARCGGGTRAPGGGASCLGEGRSGSGALPPPTARPLGGLPGSTTHWLWVRGGAGVGTRHQPHSARSCVLWGRHEGVRGGRLLPGCGASGVGRSPTPTARPLGWLPGPTTHWLWVRGGAGVGTRHQTHSARSRTLWGRHDGARGGCLLPGCGASGVGHSPTPDCPPSGQATGAHYPLAVGAGGCGRGDPSPTPQRALLRAVGAA